ncbi:MAG: fluoride efflux transporter CrcB [Actinomycetia bacterium]|nr:fluoride efflux transporter CrcB [Actinomycetes bacterium]MCP4224387.1 fluoride efflux transporter CrcB [Actinomycetes bacterium]MCP5030717.1 fluoride efflux transporter CrcB [Actinomycetes bacterium]
MIVALFVVAAAVGATARYVASDVFNRAFPTGTLMVNIVASLALGWLSRAGSDWEVVIGVGGLGALSTWSTVASEVAQMGRDRQGALAILYLAATTTTGVVAAWVGLQLAELGT